MVVYEAMGVNSLVKHEFKFLVLSVFFFFFAAQEWTPPLIDV